jgi:phosphatidylinositol alpha-1,6-mannosyltransferase
MARTLVVTNDFPPRQGGIETFVYSLTKRFDPEDVVVYTSRRGQGSGFDQDLQFRVIRARTRMLLPTPLVTSRVVDLIEEYDCDAVWFGAAAPLALMTPALRSRSGARQFIATTHAHEATWMAARPGAAALRRIGDAVDHITYISEYMRSALSKVLTPQARERLVYLSPGATPAAFDGAAPPLPTGLDLDGHDVILHVGRVIRRKGQDTLIEAMPRVLEAHPNALALIVGQGPDLTNMRKLALKLGVGDAVRFTGGVPFELVPALYAAAKVFALPTRDALFGYDVEGLPLVCLEAAAAGLPVIVGRSGGAPESIREGETGFSINSTTPGPLADRLIELLSDPARARAMGQAGRDWVRTNWDWDQRHQTLAGLLHPAPAALAA